MNDNPTAIQKIDWVLEFVATSPLMRGGISWQSIYDKTREIHPELADMEDWGDQLNQILEQLEIEGYVKHLPRIVSGRHDGFVGVVTQHEQYRATFKGGFFHSKNGYQGQIDRDSAAERRLVTEDIRNNNEYTRNNYIFWVTISIAFATGAQGAWNLLETIRNYYTPLLPAFRYVILPVAFPLAIVLIPWMVKRKGSQKMNENK